MLLYKLVSLKYIFLIFYAISKVVFNIYLRNNTYNYYGIGRGAGVRKSLPSRGVASEDSTVTNTAEVIPSQDSLIGDLLSMDLNPPSIPVAQNIPASSNIDLLGGGLDVLVSDKKHLL